MSESPFDLGEQYADASNLNDRIALHERYSTADVDLKIWQFDQFESDAGADVLTVGCGTGTLWAENADRIPEGWSITLTDFSPGMVEEARETLADCDHAFASRVADAARLPFADDSFDAVTAHHMLYHVPDRGAAVAEFRRVLREDGRLYATTNSEENLRELYDVVESVTGDRPVLGSARFTLENGCHQLESHFSSVECRPYDDGLEVTEPEPAVRYLLSRDDVDDSLAPELHAAVVDRIEDGDGLFRVQKDVGMFVAAP